STCAPDFVSSAMSAGDAKRAPSGPRARERATRAPPRRPRLRLLARRAEPNRAVVCSLLHSACGGTMMKARDIMKPARWTISPDDTLGRAERIMARRRLHDLLVVEAGALAGLLSERDLLDYRATATDEDWWRVPVRRAMEGIPATVNPDESVTTALERLS